jgi:uncharacterized SAM-binding protein YcdF (DUF218 family)
VREQGLEAEVIGAGEATTTHGEAVGAARLFSGRGWRRVIVVTTPLHSRRAAAAFEAQGLEVISLPAVETEYDLESLGTPEERIRALGPALHERVGLLVYGWRGWIRAGS